MDHHHIAIYCHNIIAMYEIFCFNGISLKPQSTMHFLQELLPGSCLLLAITYVYGADNAITYTR